MRLMTMRIQNKIKEIFFLSNVFLEWHGSLRKRFSFLLDYYVVPMLVPLFLVVTSFLI